MHSLLKSRKVQWLQLDYNIQGNTHSQPRKVTGNLYDKEGDFKSQRIMIKLNYGLQTKGSSMEGATFAEDYYVCN